MFFFFFFFFFFWGGGGGFASVCVLIMSTGKDYLLLVQPTCFMHRFMCNYVNIISTSNSETIIHFNLDLQRLF